MYKSNVGATHVKIILYLTLLSFFVLYFLPQGSCCPYLQLLFSVLPVLPNVPIKGQWVQQIEFYILLC